MTEENLWATLSTMTAPIDSVDNPLVIKPVLTRERATLGVHQGASVSNILPAPGASSLSHVYQQLCVGLMRNIKEMLPKSYLQEQGITEILCTGSVFTRHPYMLTAVTQVHHGLAVSIAQEVDAAFGAVLMTDD